jgi:hypothetical protein
MLRIFFTALLAAAPATAEAAYDADTPVERIAADPDAAAVLNRDLPGLLTDSQYNLFKSMSLKQLQRASDGEMSEADMEKAVADLQTLPVRADLQAPPAH